MAFQVSPGVEVKEIDATSVVPAVSTSIGGFAGSFNWGPVEEIVTVGSEKELAAKFGTSDSNTFKYFLTAAAFLKYGNALKIVRAADGGVNATTDGTGQLIKNKDDYDNNYSLGELSKGLWASKYPGLLGNSISVSICTQGITDFQSWAYADSFNSAPGTSEYADGLGKTTANDEMHIAIIDTSGLITGTAGGVLETYAYVSQASDAKKSDGTTNYYKEVINSGSNFIWWIDHSPTLSSAGSALTDAAVTSFVISTTAITNTLSGGTDASSVSVASIQNALALFDDSETVDVNLLFAVPDANGSADIATSLITIANTRKDCMAFVSPPIEDSVGTSSPAADIKTWADGLTSTSYASADSTALYVYDKYNDVYRWIGAAGHIAGLCANADTVADAWFSPAGVNRGQLLGVTKLAFNPKKADRDTLYKARVNPIVSFPGQGTMLYGDKTLLSKPSAFDRINVRRLFIVLEKAISTASKAQLFEFNDEFTRAQFRNMIEPFMRDVKGRRGLTDFLVVCDTTNNTGQVIDTNSFVADIYIKPARSINFITLNFIATRTGVDFSEIAGV